MNSNIEELSSFIDDEIIIPDLENASTLAISNNTVLQSGASVDDASLDIARLWLQGFLVVIFGAFGLLGNTGSIIYFSTGRRYRRQFEALMLWLAVWDNIFIICALMGYAVPDLLYHFKIDSDFSAYTIPWLVPIMQIAITCNIFFTMAISIERYLVICKPLFHRARRSSTSKPYVISIMLFALVYNLSKFFELETIVLDDDARGKFVNTLVR